MAHLKKSTSVILSKYAIRLEAEQRHIQRLTCIRIGRQTSFAILGMFRLINDYMRSDWRLNESIYKN